MNRVTWIRRYDGLFSVMSRTWLVVAGLIALATLILASNSGQPAMAASFTVTTTNDGGPGSLRQAILGANASPGADTINVPAGNYVLTISGTGENASATGDLDITDDLTITGAGAATTVIDGNALDRVLHVMPGVVTEISGLSVSGGVIDTSGGFFPRILVTGGGILNEGSLAILDVTVDSNDAVLGGGIGNVGTLIVSDSAVTRNSASPGGGIYTSGPLNMFHSAIEENVSTCCAGGIQVDGTTAVIEDSTISNNVGDVGGGINFGREISSGFAQVRLVRTTVDGNNGGDYAGIGNNFPESGDLVTLIDSTVSNNVATRAIGGVGGPFLAINSTISGNSATYAGGGLQAKFSSKLINSTVTGNSVSPGLPGHGGGGIFFGSGTLELINTIVAGNAADIGPDIQSTGDAVTSLGHNLIGDGTDSLGIVDGVNGDQVGTSALPIDALLGPLQNNSGPTETHALLPGSPAIDAADTLAGPSMDQRGVARPQGAESDIGAYEAAAEINDSLAAPGVLTSYNPTPVPNAPAGVFTISATFSNTSADSLSDLFFDVAVLSGGNLVLNCDGGPGGVGCDVLVPDSALGPDGVLSPGESFTVDFEIGLQTASTFDFFVDAFGVVVTVSEPPPVPGELQLTENVVLTRDGSLVSSEGWSYDSVVTPLEFDLIELSRRDVDSVSELELLELADRLAAEYGGDVCIQLDGVILVDTGDAECLPYRSEAGNLAVAAGPGSISDASEGTNNIAIAVDTSDAVAVGGGQKTVALRGSLGLAYPELGVGTNNFVLAVDNSEAYYTAGSNNIAIAFFNSSAEATYYNTGFSGGSDSTAVAVNSSHSAIGDSSRSRTVARNGSCAQLENADDQVLIAIDGQHFGPEC